MCQIHPRYTISTFWIHLRFITERLAIGHQTSAGVKVEGLGVSRLNLGSDHSVSRVYQGVHVVYLGFMWCIWVFHFVYGLIVSKKKQDEMGEVKLMKTRLLEGSAVRGNYVF